MKNGINFHKTKNSRSNKNNMLKKGNANLKNKMKSSDYTKKC